MKVKTKELYIKKSPKATPAEPKGDSSRKCTQLLTGEQHSAYSALKKARNAVARREPARL